MGVPSLFGGSMQEPILGKVAVHDRTWWMHEDWAHITHHITSSGSSSNRHSKILSHSHDPLRLVPSVSCSKGT